MRLLAESRDVSWAHMLANGPVEATEKSPMAAAIPPQPDAQSGDLRPARLSADTKQPAAALDVVKAEEAVPAVRGGMPGQHVSSPSSQPRSSRTPN